MEKVSALLHIVSLVAVLGLAAMLWSQSSEIDELQKTVSELQAEVGHTPAAVPPSVVAEPAVGDAAEPEKSESALDRAWQPSFGRPSPPDPSADPDAVAAAANLDVEDPEVRMKLRDVIAEEQKYLREQRQARRQENMENRIRERVREVAEEHGFAEGTTVQVEDLLAVELAEVSEMFRKAREDGTWREVRGKMGTVREETDAQVKSLLTEEEFAAYREMRDEDMRWGGRGRGNDSDRGSGSSTNGNGRGR